MPPISKYPNSASRAGPRRRKPGNLPVILLVILALLAALGLWLTVLSVPQGPAVVVYTALDEEFSRPILERFTAETGIRVLAKYDTESTKTVGLTQALLAERSRPRCDLFWNNEIVNTLRLERADVLRKCDTSVVSAFPREFRSPEDKWCGFAARARILLVNTDRVSQAEMPGSIEDLCDPKWKHQVAIAKPLAGTTASHAACLFAAWGSEKAEDFFRRLKANAHVLGGNRQVAQAVGAGNLDFGLTDTDDALLEIAAGKPVKIVYPDQGDGQLGTLFIPNTLCLIDNSPHADNAERLLEYLLSPETERSLANGPSAQIPLRPGLEPNPLVESPATVRAMQVDFEKAAFLWDEVAEFLRDEFASAQ